MAKHKHTPSCKKGRQHRAKCLDTGVLPSQPDPINAPEVRAAITRKACALSLAAFDHNRTVLESWLRRCGDISDPEAAVERIHALELEHGKHIMVDIQLLWDLIGCAKSARRATEIQMMAVARMEAATGRTLA